ncbi:MAG: CapA family protein [Clostridia bacterium]|nr:CapA family protein [Clostridia bacterium]
MNDNKPGDASSDDGKLPDSDKPADNTDPAKPEEPTNPDTPAVPNEPVVPDVPAEPDVPEVENKIIKIVAAGDNLLHNTISFDAKQSDGTYDFSSIYTRIAPITSAADIAFINQEIMLTGKISGYPRMEAPAEVADALIDAGFNVINLASNHSLDKGEDGLAACLANVKERPFDAVLGAYETQEESITPILVEKEGIIFGFLSYTYDMNGYTLSEGNEWKVDLINEPKMKKDVQAIRPLCDYLIVSMHWGVEYNTEPSKYQRQLAELLCNNGVDLIIGTHPHVLQPLETLVSADGQHSTICAWSLGNFISNQHRLETMLGGMLQVELEFDPDNKLVSSRSGIIPTVTQYDDNAKNYKVHLLNEYTEDLAAVHGIRKHASEPLSLTFLNELAQRVLGDAITDEIY